MIGAPPGEMPNMGLTGPELAPAGPSTPELTPVPSTPTYTATPAPMVEEAPRMLIVPPEVNNQRSQNMELVAREADIHTRRGFELAGRGATFSARGEFLMALRLVAQGLDTERNTRFYESALSAGITALREAEDFLPKGESLEADIDVRAIIATHRTPVLRDSATTSLTSMAALQCYSTFAQEQLAAAMDREVAGSIALYGLGKLHKVLSEQHAVTVVAARPKAMVFYQAALLTYPENHMASNDLGVLLAQAGRYEDARMALEHSVALHQNATGWHNLAVVYQNLGRADLAQRAEWLSQSSRKTEQAKASQVAASSQQPVSWVDSQAFAQTSGQTLTDPQGAASKTPEPARPVAVGRPNVARTRSDLPNNKK
jgi:tetratricopeptide (TPR) repeat protein